MSAVFFIFSTDEKDLEMYNSNSWPEVNLRGREEATVNGGWSRANVSRLSIPGEVAVQGDQEDSRRVHEYVLRFPAWSPEGVQ